jgi:hypothetical protein
MWDVYHVLGNLYNVMWDSLIVYRKAYAMSMENIYNVLLDFVFPGILLSCPCSFYHVQGDFTTFMETKKYDIFAMSCKLGRFYRVQDNCYHVEGDHVLWDFYHELKNI